MSTEFNCKSFFKFIQTVLIQTIHFSICIVFVYAQLTVKTVLFQTIQFIIQEQFHFKQFSLAHVRSLIVKTVLFQAIQFRIRTHFKCQNRTI